MRVCVCVGGGTQLLCEAPLPRQPSTAPCAPVLTARLGLGCHCPLAPVYPSGTQLPLRATALSPSSSDAWFRVRSLVHGRRRGRRKERAEKSIASAPSVFREQLNGRISGRGPGWGVGATPAPYTPRGGCLEPRNSGSPGCKPHAGLSP